MEPGIQRKCSPKAAKNNSDFDKKESLDSEFGCAAPE
jgi:hypothetical protein